MGHMLDIKFGYRCNNHCQFCVAGDRRDRIFDRSTEEIMRIMEKRRDHNDEVVFTGGEVTIRDDLFALIRHARQSGYRDICIQTNGRMFSYEAFCEKAIEAGANHFLLALHGSTAGMHDGLTRAPGSFAQTSQGIKNLMKLGRDIRVNTVINKVNYRTLPEIATLLISWGCRKFQFAFMHISSVIKNDPALIEQIVPRKSQVEPYVKEALAIGLDHGCDGRTEAIPYCFMAGYEGCVAERRMPAVSVEDIFFIEDFGALRKESGKMKGPRCGTCAYDRVCEGPWREYPEIFGWQEFKPVKKHERARRKTRLCVQ